ncbi:orotidine-5'-phosphate decarboxylase [bacterium]|nr:orotidine-5'-phosphate decarboxylase [bacterium]
MITPNGTAAEKLIFALDVDALAKATPFIEGLSPYMGCFKIGLELMNAVGTPQSVQHVLRHGGQVFADCKLNDIPNTVRGASRAIASMGVKFFNVHASAGLEAVKAAAEEKGTAKLLVVTVLTSLDDTASQQIFGKNAREKVIDFAKEAVEAGADGLICSSQELELLGQNPEFKNLLKVTPGIRPTWAQSDDQKRTLTPKEAIQAGATHLVIGRPISSPPRGIGNPIDAAKAILEEISSCLPPST